MSVNLTETLTKGAAGAGGISRSDVESHRHEDTLYVGGEGPRSEISLPRLRSGIGSTYVFRGFKGSRSWGCDYGP